jgi:V/A-type H+-transporting ATPase subunit B
VVQRILTPRIALTVAEYLAFECDQHVLVVLADMTSYCEAVREVSAARGEMPGRRAYPSYLYSDLASIYERCGRIRGKKGSLTLVPVLTMPANGMTHPVPDLTGYTAGVYPPVDVLNSLSRMMRKGTGEGRTRADHPALAAQIIAGIARSQQSRDLSDLIGAAALTDTDRSYLDFAAAFASQFVNQGVSETRTLDETLRLAWNVVSILPRRELTMIPAADIDKYYTDGKAAKAAQDG